MRDKPIIRLSDMSAAMIPAGTVTLADIARAAGDVIEGTGELVRYRKAQAAKAREKWEQDEEHQLIADYERRALAEILVNGSVPEGYQHHGPKRGKKINQEKLAEAIRTRVEATRGDAPDLKTVKRHLPRLLAEAGVTLHSPADLK